MISMMLRLRVFRRGGCGLGIPAFLRSPITRFSSYEVVVLSEGELASEMIGQGCNLIGLIGHEVTEEVLRMVNIDEAEPVTIG
ncbi:hypothetical protein Tco_1483830 [Tanacetum coccineum]